MRRDRGGFTRHGEKGDRQARSVAGTSLAVPGMLPGGLVDRRRAERQIRIVVALYRAEAGRRDSDAMISFRNRAKAIFDQLEPQIEADPALLAELERARRELRPDES